MLFRVSASSAQGFCPHCGITVARPLGVKHTCFTMFRSQAFAASQRFTPSPGFVSLFHPTTTSRIFAVQGLLHPRSRPTSSARPCPLTVSTPPIFLSKLSPNRRRLSFEALLHVKVRCHSLGVNLAMLAPLLGFLSPAGVRKTT